MNKVYEAFTYQSAAGVEERVELTDGGLLGRAVEIYADDGWEQGSYENIAVVADDIPKLIEALAAAYDLHLSMKGGE